MKHASHSVLSLYSQCPRRYKVERVEKRKAPDSKPLKVGSATHAAIAAYIRHLEVEGLQTDVTWAAQAIEAARVAMDKEGRKLTAEEWDEVAGILDTFISAHMFEPSQIAEIEKKEEIHLDGLTFWAVIDLLEVEDGEPRVRDWKTNWNVASQAEVEKDPQLARYAWAVSKLYGYDEVRCDLEFVRYGTVRSVVMGPEQIAKAEAGILEGVKAIEADTDFTPTPGSHCTWCAWADECTAVSGDATEDPLQLAAEILVLERQVRERKDKLATWCTENGPVVVGGEIFGYLPSKDGGWTVTDKPAFADVLVSHGLPPYDYFSVNGTKLKSLRTAKKWAAVLADVEPLLEREVKTTFTHRKAEE
jgi:CRISPR/Cas system-associated exonuclease Cas4 (RecB family)